MSAVYTRDLKDWMQRHPLAGRLFSLALLSVLPLLVLWEVRAGMIAGAQRLLRIAFTRWR